MKKGVSRIRKQHYQYTQKTTQIHKIYGYRWLEKCLSLDLVVGIEKETKQRQTVVSNGKECAILVLFTRVLMLQLECLRYIFVDIYTLTLYTNTCLRARTPLIKLWFGFVHCFICRTIVVVVYGFPFVMRSNWKRYHWLYCCKCVFSHLICLCVDMNSFSLNWHRATCIT